MIVLALWPIMLSAWSSNRYGLKLSSVHQRSQLHMIYIGLTDLIVLLIVGPWLIKPLPLIALRYIGHTLYAERVMTWWQRVTWRE